MQDYHEYLDEVLIGEDALQKRIKELGAQISADYQGEKLLLICILRGGVMFLTDLMRSITIPISVDFMAVSSYGTGRESTGQVRITLDLQENISQKERPAGGRYRGQRLYHRLRPGVPGDAPPQKPQSVHAAG